MISTHIYDVLMSLCPREDWVYKWTQKQKRYSSIFYTIALWLMPCDIYKTCGAEWSSKADFLEYCSHKDIRLKSNSLGKTTVIEVQ